MLSKKGTEVCKILDISESLYMGLIEFASDFDALSERLIDTPSAEELIRFERSAKFIRHLGDLERKARRYDLLIEAEKSGEGMAGK